MNIIKSEEKESESILRTLDLLDFLSKVLDENYELVIHSFRKNKADGNIIAIKNGYISGRKIGDGLLPEGKQVLLNDAFLYSNNIINYGATSANGESLVCSAMFIGEEGSEPAGIFSINRKYETARNDKIGSAISAVRLASNFRNQSQIKVVTLSSVNEEMTKAIVQVTKGAKSVPEKLTLKERLLAISVLKERGVFELKNAIQAAADFFNISKPTMYRYLKNA